MPNNFRKTGAFYISPDGNDANAGTGPDIPKRTLTRYGGGYHIVGAGEYKGAPSIEAAVFDGDGFAKINLTGAMIVGFSAGSILKNMFIAGNGNMVRSFGLGFSTENCVYENAIISFPTGYGLSTNTFQNCVKNGCTETEEQGGGVEKKCAIFNSAKTVPGTLGNIQDSYCDESYILSGTAYYASPATDFKNNNFRGQIVIAGTPYELKKKKDGTAINPNPGVADLVAIDATVYDRGNFSEDPLFLNLAKGDYWAVSPASPMLFADSTGIGNIGGVFAAVTVKATDPSFASPAANSGLSDFAGGIVWASPPGTRLIQPIQVATTEGKPLKKGIIAALMNFNNLEAVGSVENKDVTATTDYAPGTAGANPQRVKTVKLRIKSTLAAPVNASSFDNNGYIAAGDFFDFEVLGNDTDFLVDVSGKGTGDPSFNASGARYTSAVWVQQLLIVQEGLS